MREAEKADNEKKPPPVKAGFALNHGDGVENSTENREAGGRPGAKPI